MHHSKHQNAVRRCYTPEMSERPNSMTRPEQLPYPSPKWQRIAWVGARLCSLMFGVLSLAAMIAACGIVTGSDRRLAVTVTKFYGYPAVIALVLAAALRWLLWHDQRRRPIASASQRRWPRFSLRALFVMLTTAAILTAWAVSNYRWAHQRREFMAAAGAVNGHERTVQGYHTQESRTYIWWLLFRDHRVTFVHLFPGTFDDAYLVQVRELFPDAEISISSDPNAEPKLAPK